MADLPLVGGECEMALGGLIGLDCNGRAHCNDLLRVPGHVSKAHAGDVAEVQEYCGVTLVQHLEPAHDR